MTKTIGMGGGCHWCTEAVFDSLKGVIQVEQGYIASKGKASSLSEAVKLTFDPRHISLATLIEIHLYTHESTSNHSFRQKYRSAIYTLDQKTAKEAQVILNGMQKQFRHSIVTEVLPLVEFLPSRAALHDYFYSDPDKPFCKRYITPKLRLLLQQFRKDSDLLKLKKAGVEESE